MTSALDTVQDPLITPLLALAKDAVNADVVLDVDPAATPEAAVATTAPHPVPIEILGETALPVLACYRIRARTTERSLLLTDYTYTLQWVYVSPATAREQLDERWPLLNRVWLSLMKAVYAGQSPAHAAGVDVLGPIGVIDMPGERALKREFFYDGGDYAYPAFVWEMEVVMQDDSATDTTGLWPALSFLSQFWIDSGVTAEPPDVSVISYTPLGKLVRDGLVTEDSLRPPTP